MIKPSHWSPVDPVTYLLGWVHVSDIHVGHGNLHAQADQRNTLLLLLKDAATQLNTGLMAKPNLIFVTGDIGNTGGAVNPVEYEVASEWIDALASAVRVGPEHVFLVPGNHDVNRSARPVQSITGLIGRLRSDPAALDNVLGGDAGTDSDVELLDRRMAGYLSVARKYGASFGTTPGQHGYWHHRLQLPELPQVHLVGLNTALLSIDEHDYNNLRIGQRQLNETLLQCQRDLELVIVLSHHPLEWLADGDQADASGYLRTLAHLHLHGHLHKHDTSSTWAGDATHLITVAGGATHGEGIQLPGYPGHGYNFAAVLRDAEGRHWLRIWPRFKTRNQTYRAYTTATPDHKEYADHLLDLPEAVGPNRDPVQPVAHSAVGAPTGTTVNIRAPLPYEQRGDAEALIDLFWQAEQPALLFIDKSGAGKTTLLEHAYSQLPADWSRAWCRAADWSPEVSLELILDENLEPAGDSIAEVLHAVKRVVLFVDGINENSDPKGVIADLNALLRKYNGPRAPKLIATCRPERFNPADWDHHLFWKPRDRVELVDDIGVPINHLSAGQVRQLWDHYGKLWDVRLPFDEVPEWIQAESQARPLILRLLAQGFSKGAQIPPRLTSQQVLARYFYRYVGDDSPVPSADKIPPVQPGERRFLNVLLDRMADPVTADVRLEIPVEELDQFDAGQTLLPARSSLLAKGVLEQSQLLGPLQMQFTIRFALEQLLEFALARRLHERGTGCDYLEPLIIKGGAKAAVWGAARMFVLLQIRPPEGSAADEMAAARAGAWVAATAASCPGLRGLLTDALLSLVAEDVRFVERVCNVLMTARDQDELNVAAVNIATTIAVQLRNLTLLVQGCGLRVADTRLVAAQGVVHLWQQDYRRGNTLGALLANDAHTEVARVLRDFKFIFRLARLMRGNISKEDGEWLIKEANERAPRLLSFVHLCSLVHALELGHIRRGAALMTALADLAEGRSLLYRMSMEFLMKRVAARMMRNAFAAEARLEPAEQEIRQMNVRTALRDANLALVSAWGVDVDIDADPFKQALRVASGGGVLSAIAFRGALISALTTKPRATNPDAAVRLALEFGDSENDVQAWQGLSAAGFLVPAALSLSARREATSQPWFRDLASGLVRSLVKRWQGDERVPVVAFGALECPIADLPHTITAHAAAGGDVSELIDMLSRTSQGQPSVTREAEIIRALKAPSRLGYPNATLTALSRWRRTNGLALEVRDALADLLAALLVERPIDGHAEVQTWLDRSDDSALDGAVARRLVDSNPNSLVFQYGMYSYVGMMTDRRVANELRKVGMRVFAPVSSAEKGLRILGDLLFDPQRTRFLYGAAPVARSSQDERECA